MSARVAGPFGASLSLDPVKVQQSGFLATDRPADAALSKTSSTPARDDYFKSRLPQKQLGRARFVNRILPTTVSIDRSHSPHPLDVEHLRNDTAMELGTETINRVDEESHSILNCSAIY